MLKRLFILVFAFSAGISFPQDQESGYRYFVDLNNVVDDKLEIELTVPAIESETALFRFPAMVPGTYSVYNFGRYISDLRAYDKSGTELSVTKTDQNSWEIGNAQSLDKIVYKARETFGDKDEPKVFEPAGTAISKDEVFLFNNHGFFGYIEGMVDHDYELTFRKPGGFYGSTSMEAVSRTEDTEVFTAKNYHDVVDNPIMFTVPDTATISFEEMNVLMSVYSPGKGLSAKDFQEPNRKLLGAIRNHLGGKLPADRYTFIYFFSDMEGGSGGFGALEHKTSSVYYMPDVPAQAKSFMISQLEPTNAHEFYHIVTPLNLHSEEIGNFDFNNPVMSKHLWLYEGTTEYFADYIRLREGLISLEDYLNDTKEKMNGSMRYNDSLAFTEMSKGALDKYVSEYLNVYQKGALIGLCLDILIREESNGAQGWQDVINKLLEKYGKDKAFRDDELFDEIEALTSPKIGEFFDKYVDGPNRIPYDEFFSKIGLTAKSIPYEVIDIQGIQIGFNQATFRLVVNKLSNPENEFLKDLGLKEGDELISVNGQQINYMNASSMFGSVKNKIRKGDTIKLVVARKSGSKFEEKELEAKIVNTKTSYDYEVAEMKSPDAKASALRKAWLGK